MSPHEAAVETEVLCEYMGLIAHCVTLASEGDIPRSPGKILITTHGEAWVVEVIDPDPCCSIRVLGETVDQALRLADRLVRSKTAVWSPISKGRALV